MSLNNIYLFFSILVALCTLSGMIVTSFLHLNKSFREYLTKLLEKHSQETKNWTRQILLDYYYSLDTRLTHITDRLKILEQKYDKQFNNKNSN